MPIPEDLSNGFRIGDCEVFPARRIIRRDGEEISPEPKVWGVLMSLAARSGDVVTRDELVDEVWAGRPTGDEPINRCISQLRKHLGDSRPYRYIRPVTGSGYLLQEPVVPLADAGEEQYGEELQPRRKLWPFIVVIAAIAVVGSVLLERASLTNDAIRSIVVLPFENASGEPEDRYLASGFRDEFAAILQRIDELTVKTGRNPYPDRTAEEIGATFDVDSVLRGNVQRSGDVLKVTYEVSRSSNGEVIAASGITDDVRNVFDLQERLARQVRDDLFGSSDRQLFAASRPSNFDAYDSYLQGIYAFTRRGIGRNLDDAIGLFEDTIRLDPSFGPAYLQLATATALLPAYRGADSEASNRRAIEIVEQGVSVDASIEAAGGAVFGFVYHSQKDWARSERAYQKATAAEVVDVNAYNWYSRMLASVGRLDESLAQALEAWQLDQDNPVINSRVAMSYFWLGDAVNARRYFERAHRLGAEGTTHLLAYALFLAEQEDIDGAIEVARTAAAQAGYSPEWIDTILKGMQDEALAPTALEAVAESLAAGQLSPQIEVVARTLLGDLDGAMKVAQMLRQPGEAFEMDLLWIPQFRPLREHPQFLDLMRELGVVEYWDANGCLFVSASVRCPAG